MTWTFPISKVPQSPPSVPELRQLTIKALSAMAALVRAGNCPVQVAPLPTALTPGWMHWHPWPELFLQISGSSRFETPVGDVAVNHGNCLMMPPLFAHNEFVGSSRSPFCNVVFTIIDRHFSYHVALADSLHSNRPQVTQLDLIDPEDHQLGFAALVGLAQSAASPHDDARAGWLLAFCGWASRVIEAAPPPGFSGSERVRRTHELVRARLGSSSLSVAQLGAWIGCHPDHLARQFRRETGETIIGYIRRHRLERAHELLADRTLSVSHIGRLVGLPDPTYFSRAYRQAYGIPPGAARRAVLHVKV